MTIQEITKYLDYKIKLNPNEVTITFYEARVELDLSEEETDTFLDLCKNRLTNLNYNVYVEKINCKNKALQKNQLLIAKK